MDIIKKKEQDRFVIIIDYEQRFSPPETITSFSAVCIQTDTLVDVSSTMLFYEDTVYQQQDYNYGAGRYGGVPDNLLNSTMFGIQAGTSGSNYKITVKAITSQNNKFEKDVIVEVRDAIDASFIKQPYERFNIELNYYNMIFDEDVRYDDTISSQVNVVTRKIDGVVVTNDIVSASQIEGSGVRLGIKDGTNGNAYNINNKITTVQGYNYALDVLMKVEES